MRCNFVVGQKVVCIAKGAWRHTHSDCVSPGPKYGDICLIDKISAYGDEVYLGFREFTHVIPMTMEKVAFWAKWFRPLQERKTDISCFTALLNPVKQREDA